MTLRGLIEAVERGEYSDSMFCAMFHSQGLCTECEGAFSGSLDAAKRLHDALLPGWWAMLRHSTRPSVTIGYVEAVQEAQDDNLARAWLLAVLRALDADQREGGRE